MKMPRLKAVLLLPILLSILASMAASALQVFTEEWPPITFSEDNKPSGLAVEVVQAMQKRIGQQQAIQVVPWARGYRMATTLPDVMLFTTTRTAEREQLFTMLGPVALGVNHLYVRRNDALQLRTLEEAKSLGLVGVYKDSVWQQQLERQGFDTLDISPDPQSAARKLLAGRVRFWYDSNLTAPAILKELHESPGAIRSVMAVEENALYLAFSKGTPASTIETWRQALQAVKDSGEFTRIYQRWLPGEKVPMRVEVIGVPPGSPTR